MSFGPLSRYIIGCGIVGIWALTVCPIAAQSVTTSNHFNKLVITGNEINLHEDLKTVSANGKVHIQYQRLNVHTEAFSYEFDKKLLTIPEPFLFESRDNRMTGRSFCYDLKKYKGEATDIDSRLGKVHLQGSKIRFEGSKFVVENAVITTCDGNDISHYVIKSKSVHVYPILGFFVAYGTEIQSNLVPFPIYLPTFPYGSHNGIIGNTSIVPEFGSTNREGFYAKQRLGFFMSGQSTGTVDLGYIERFGVWAGFTHGFKFNQNHKLRTSFHSLGRKGYEGGLKYFYDVPKKKKKVEKDQELLNSIIEPFIANQTIPLSRLTLQMTYKELINDSLVDYAPLLHLETDKNFFRDSQYYYQTFASYGQVGEDAEDEPFLRLWESHIQQAIGKEFQITPKLKADWNVRYFGYWYETEQTWQRAFSTILFEYDFPLLEPQFSYTKRLMNTIGGSPFRFEENHAIGGDEIGAKLKTRIGIAQLSYGIDYDLEVKDLRTQDVAIEFLFQCWSFGFNWSIKQGSFNFIFNMY